MVGKVENLETLKLEKSFQVLTFTWKIDKLERFFFRKLSNFSFFRIGSDHNSPTIRPRTFLTKFFVYLVTQPNIPIPIFAQYWVFISLFSSVIFIFKSTIWFWCDETVNYFNKKVVELLWVEVDTFVLIFADGAKKEEGMKWTI